MNVFMAALFDDDVSPWHLVKAARMDVSCCQLLTRESVTPLQMDLCPPK